MDIDRLPGVTLAPSSAGLTVAVTDGRVLGRGPTFVVAQGFLAWIEPFEMQRFRLIAQLLAARLIVVETPGCGTGGARLSWPQRRGLLAGNFRGPAARMFGAAAALLNPGETVSVLGYSMGASVAVALAEAAARAGFPVQDLVLVEPVALRRWRLRQLVAAAHRESRWVGGYFDSNAANSGAAEPWPRRLGGNPSRWRVDLLLAGAALRRGALGEEIPTTSAAAVTVVLAADSELTRGVVVPASPACRIVTVPGRHGFWHSLPAVAALCRQLNTTSPTPPAQLS